VRGLLQEPVEIHALEEMERYIIEKSALFISAQAYMRSVVQWNRKVLEGKTSFPALREARSAVRNG
jgi:hypothetical protein